MLRGREDESPGGPKGLLGVCRIVVMALSESRLFWCRSRSHVLRGSGHGASNEYVELTTRFVLQRSSVDTCLATTEAPE